MRALDHERRIMEKLNVLHVMDKLSLGGSTIHGVTQLFSWWFPLFDHERYDVRLCSLRSRDKAGEHVENLGAQVYYLNRSKYDPRTLGDLVKLIRQQKIQILHLHGYGAATFGRLAARIVGIPAIVHEHMYDAKIPVYQKLADRVLSGSTAWSIAVSRSVRDFLINDRSFPQETLEIIYNGAPLSIATKNGKRSNESELPPGETWREKLGIPMANRVVAVVGRLHLIKGHTYFLQAARKVLASCDRATFLVVGDGQLMEALQEESRKLGIEDHVIFSGYCAEVPALLQEVDIKVISSLSEGIPLTLFEAMAAGCPVVSTNVGGIAEILEEGVTGFLVPPRDVDALAEKIILLLSNTALRSTMGEAASRAALKYDVSTNVRQFESLYERLAR
jgi:glycosyltransferase involved in cell wall biosynthesis